jgi:hypothetical protein
VKNLLNLYNALTQGTVDVSTMPPNPSDSTSPVYGAVDENDQTHTITSPLSHHDTSLVISPLGPPPHSIPASNIANDPPLCGILEATQRTTAAALTGPTPPLGMRGRSGTSQAVASSATTITDDIVDIPL